jgi:GTPase SAR1 family protein
MLVRHFNLKGVKYTFWDIAGNKNFYRIWKNYIGDADLIVFFVDACSKIKSKVEEDVSAFKIVVEDPQAQGKKILFLMNKNVSYKH